MMDNNCPLAYFRDRVYALRGSLIIIIMTFFSLRKSILHGGRVPNGGCACAGRICSPRSVNDEI